MTDSDVPPRSASPQPATADAFDVFRAGFPALSRVRYLSICDKMILHDTVRGAVDQFLDHLAMASASRSEHEIHVERSRTGFAQMMNVAPETIGVVRNVSDGINAMAWALPWQDGDNLVVSLGAEHPNNSYPWLRLKRRGVELRNIPTLSSGALDIEAMIAAMDGATRLVTCPSVSFAPGHRTDLERLAEACHKRDIFLAVDGVQSAGILHHDLSALPVSGFATSTSKGLIGLYGFGFVYIAPSWIDRLEPAYLSRPAVAMEGTDHSAMGSLDYALQPDSRRFEVGSYNLAGAYAADAALGLLNTLGTRHIETKVLTLSAQLKDALAGLGLAPSIGSDGPDHSHIVTTGTLDAGGHGYSNSPVITRLSAALAEASISHTIRRGQLRFGLHAYNNASDIDTVDDVLRAAMAMGRRKKRNAW
ncbi:aminotransferase class V-fold PLP-dependent enzyme [Martelella radicis]|uniref:Selenocysteine lyase/cysteine desulfurase n=1 Tax=Martelella radicis TaxID=1397476 RepID=A0A7W6PBK1_9HYPH|nr:aminotransferase class V-fold PLP-dependent enzyme [Martelella radicis]MBB4124567.1 selenocysteine lyase/cysteine desulfurase [Martelella radicis]